MGLYGVVATGHDGGMSTLITTVSGAGGVAPLAILWAPKGEHRLKCSVNGEPGECVVRVSEDCVSRLNADLEAKLAGNVKPVGLYDHTMGAASYKPSRFLWDDEKGVVLMLDGWTERGKRDVEGGNYGYHSPRFRRDKGTGEILGLLPDSIEVGSLVNDPAFDDIERIAAARVSNDSVAHFEVVEDGGSGGDTGSLEAGLIAGSVEGYQLKNSRDMDITELVGIGLLTEDEAKAENAEAIALERIKALQEQSKASSDELEASKKELAKCKEEIANKKQQDEERADEEVEEAVAAGKIAPRDEAAKAFWKRALVEDYVAAGKQLRALAKNPAFDDVKAGKEGVSAPALTGSAALRSAFESELNFLNK